MSFKSLLQDEFGSICSKVFGSRLKSQFVVDHSTSMEAIDDAEQSCWANMPPDLLKDILMRIEVSEPNWPSRKNVVSCAGVCRSWRKNMKEIVKCPQLSGKLTFPISLKQPGKLGSPIQCLIRRHPDHQIYYLYLHKKGDPYHKVKLLLAAKRVRHATCREYIIFRNYEDISKGRSTCIGKLRSNFIGTKFRVYDAHPPNAATKCHSSMLGSMKRVSPKVPVDNYPVCNISYKLTVSKSRGPRQMRCEINTIHAISYSLSRNFNLTDDSQLWSLTDQNDVKLVLKNKTPKWHARLEHWSLNFNGRVNFASLNNFQLVSCLDNDARVKEHENIILQLGKYDDDDYLMDYQYPLSTFQAFAICLSSFETKVVGEKGWLRHFGGIVRFKNFTQYN